MDKRNRLFVAGGPTGKAFVYDAATGADLASYQLAPRGTAATFVNDVVVTGKGACFTDSAEPAAVRRAASAARRRCPTRTRSASWP